MAYVAGGDIEVSVPATTTEIYALYPYYSGNTNGPGSVSVYINNAQTQTDPGQLNGRNFPMVAKGTVSKDNKALISFYPVASALALNIYHTGLSGAESVKSVTVTPSSANTGFIGRQTTVITGNSIQYTQADSSDPIVVTLANALSLQNTKPTDKQKFSGQIYVCLAKQSYKAVTFEIETDKGTYTITSSNTTPFDLENSDFVPVNIDLKKASFVPFDAAVDPTAFSWTLVKDALAVGDKVVIAAAGSNVAMSTTQNTNNRGQVGITKSDNSLTANANVQVFEVVAGSEANTVAFKCLNGDQIRKFIAAASSSNNNMHSNDNINANASWIVSINTSTGVASVVAPGSYTRNTIRYNSSNSVFSCYASGQADVVFYRAGLPSAGISFPQSSYSVDLGETFTAPTLENLNSVTVTYSSSDPDVATVDASSGAVSIVAAGTTTITASFAGNSTYSATEASYELTVVDPNVEHWVKTAIANITASDVFVIVGDDGYAMSNDNGTTSAPAATAVTIAANALSAIPAANLQWKLSGNATDGYSFYPNGSTTTWLYCTASNNGVRVGTNNNKLFKIDDKGYLFNTATSRYLSVYAATPDWRCYSNTDNNPQVIEFYVKKGGSSTPAKTLASITVTAPSKTTYSVGDPFDATGMVVTATYSDASSADVTSSATTDFAAQVASAGNKTVTVSYTEGGITETDKFDITVESSTGTTVSLSGVDLGSASTTATEMDSEISFKNSASNTYSNPMRIYANNTFTITSKTKNIIKVIFTCNSDSYADALNGGTFTVASGASVNKSVSGSVVTVTITGDTKTLSVKASAQWRLNGLSVTYN